MTGNNTIAGFQLSAQQARVWSQQTGDATAFRAVCEVLLEGNLDEDRLRQAFRTLVGRHEILRTLFQRQAGVKAPFQVIQEAADLVWAGDDHPAVFDLEKGPLLHVRLASAAPGKYTLRVSLPAMCADLTSLKNLIAEVAAEYGGAPSGEEVMQYADIAAWQEELLAGEDTQAGRAFWRDYCRNLDLAACELPGSGFAPDVVSRGVEGPMPSEELLACWQAFLARMTGAASVLTGREFDGRKFAELASAIGLFSKYLPVETAYDPQTTVRDLALRVKLTAETAYNWQEAFAWNQLAFPAALPFVFEYSELPPPQTAGGVTFSVVRQDVCSERFRLKLAARPGTLDFCFDSNLMDRATVEYWADCFLAFLTAAKAHPETPVGLLPLMPRSERDRLLIETNQTAAEYPRERCLHELFEECAARYPERPAVRFEGACLTYRDLNQKANRLAHALERAGAGPDALAGLCLDRGLDMIVALLGVLKAGVAFVPLSADHPKARLSQQLSGAAVLITEHKFLARLPEFSGVTICIDRDSLENEPASDPQRRATPANLAYVIYTSGSTGTPKGVGIRHRNLVNYTWFITRLLELETYSEGLNFATVSTLAADLGNTCIYPSLISGGCLHVIAQEVSSDSARLREYMTAWPVDVMKIVPSHLGALLAAGGGNDVLPRRYLITGGEALTPDLLEKIAATGADCAVVNHYGPTETTVGSLTLPLQAYDWKSAAAKTIPIGRPIANTQVYVLDAHREPLPVGVTGELYIAGDGVAARYLNRPELTAERFLSVPFSSDPEARMYRTGDLVRRLPDGNIEFLGRADDQVKIRGFRIELGEIEAALLRQAGVRQAVVLAREDERGDKRLVAYVTGQPDTDFLRVQLRNELPDYMVPSAIVAIAKVPLNANGKIDRQALPDPVDAAGVKKEHTAPRTPTEEVIAAIWSDVLRRDGIGTEDDFFDIGGHSLLATQIASRLRAQFHIAAPVRLIFEAPTIGGLARRVDQARREEQGLVPPAITPIPRGQALPLSFAQERLWVLDSIEPDNPLYNIPRALRLRGPLHLEALERGINEIVRRHESQRTTFGLADGNAVQIIAPSLTIPLVLREAQTEEEARSIAEEEALIPFNLSTGPLVRARLVRIAADDHVLLLTMHHIISDAWSAGIFFQELGLLYESFSQGRRSPLPELTVQYADYAAQERGWLAGDVLDQQLAYWRKQLQGAPPVLDLPSDRPRTKARGSRGSYAGVSIPPETLKAVKELARQEGATLFMTLLAGFQALLARYSGQNDIVVGTDVANRSTPETERMIGFFINLLPVRTDLSGNPTFRELLARVRDGLLEGYAHQEVPFAKIVQELQPERSNSHNPIVQVLFVMQNIPRPRKELAGLTLEGFEIPVTTSKFDIGVFMMEKADELLGYWVYSTDLFDQETILNMARHFTILLGEAATRPDERLSALEMLSAEEKQQQEESRKQRKLSQAKKLMATTPAGIGLSAKEEDKR